MGVYEWLTRQEVQEKYPDLWKAKITRQYDNAPTGGETIREVEKRIFSKLDELSLLEVGNILVVSHFFPLRVINKYFNPGLSDEDFFNFMMKNSEIREYDF
jgi:probable phosphoglycerate mutase